MMVSRTGSEVSRPSRWSTYALFAAFGGASSWFATSLAFMEIPLYQKDFGLELSNRFEVGYNLGTLPCGLFLLWSLRRRTLSLWWLLGTQLLSVLILCAAVPGTFAYSETSLVLSQFLGGTVGYLAQFTAVPFLMRFENELVGAFWTGDSATSVLAALVAARQRPDRRRPRFGLFAYFAFCGLPVVVMSVVALAVIERTQIGRLPHAVVHVSSEDPLDDDEERELVVRRAETEPLRAAAVLVKEEDPAATTTKYIGVAASSRAATAEDFSGAAAAPPLERSRRRRLTWQLATVCFWSQFADWGMGDSLYPFACARGRDLEQCELWTNELSLLAQFAGVALASKVRLDPARFTRTLWLPTFVYTLAFGLLLAVAGGLFPAVDESLVVGLMAALRFIGPYVRGVVPRLIQPCYPPALHADVPLLFGAVSVLGNVLGGATATALIAIEGGRRGPPSSSAAPRSS